jgi:hypothetical protein
MKDEGKITINAVLVRVRGRKQTDEKEKTFCPCIDEKRLTVQKN